MDAANVREAVREAVADVEEGADALIVKPGLPYLDVVRAVREQVSVPVAARASRTALIVASVPVATKRTISQPGTRFVTRSARSTSGGDMSPNSVPRASWRAIASVTRCGPCPSSAGPQAPIQSRYSRPEASRTRAPRASTIATGGIPTERNARTGERTPPGVTRCARSS